MLIDGFGAFLEFFIQLERSSFVEAFTPTILVGSDGSLSLSDSGFTFRVYSVNRLKLANLRGHHTVMKTTKKLVKHLSMQHNVLR